MTDPGEGPSGMSQFELSKLPRGAIGMSGTPVARNTRLPSIKTPRDLTLGSGGKRVFTPNIPVRREKKSMQDKALSGTGKGTGARGARGGGNRGRGRKNFVQTPGAVFGEGVGALEKNVTYRSNDYSPSAPTIQKPTVKCDVKIKSEPLYDPELSDEFIDDPDDEKEDGKLKPISVPIKNTGNPAGELKKDNADDSVSKVKKEKLSLEGGRLPQTLEELLTLADTSGSSDLFLMELTDYLDSALHLDGPANDKENEDGNSEQKAKPLLSLDNLPSGPIGKLQILADGSTRLVIGNHIFSGFLEQQTPFLQEVVTVQQSEEDTHFNVIGEVKHVAKFLPSIDIIPREDVTTIS